MAELEDAAAGMSLVRSALEALAAGDDAMALMSVNGASDAEIRWGFAYLLSCLRASVALQSRSQAQTRRHLRAALTGIDRDVVETQMALIVQQAERDL